MRARQGGAHLWSETGHNEFAISLDYIVREPASKIEKQSGRRWELLDHSSISKREARVSTVNPRKEMSWEEMTMKETKHTYNKEFHPKDESSKTFCFLNRDDRLLKHETIEK